ncbi:membrane protein [Mycobacterium phage Cuke]|uniref:Uncharacterized protein n=1 Tax=Mycobacterium phage Cuke TaxID=2079417 RepID=A0A2L1IWW9_9CAUD|nr:membrane protein [Mycobacterium phage Cuke]AVD99681.1 hypothetical protein SEA_CUKE_63 [Mycobacterium phage Cuke]
MGYGLGIACGTAILGLAITTHQVPVFWIVVAVLTIIGSLFGLWVDA